MLTTTVNPELPHIPGVKRIRNSAVKIICTSAVKIIRTLVVNRIRTSQSAVERTRTSEVSVGSLFTPIGLLIQKEYFFH
jgi:hypothetical protein